MPPIRRKFKPVLSMHSQKMSGNRSIISHSSPWLTPDDEAIVANVVKSGLIARGSLCDKFERACKEYIGASMARVTGSGQEALSLALRAVGVSLNDEVILPSYVCEAVLHAVLEVGAVPVYCDIGSDWCISAASVEPHVSEKTAAIIVVHTFGVHADVSSLKGFNIPIVEDCCQRFGNGSGMEGDISVFSFHATKCMTTGEGGLVTTGDEKLAANLLIATNRTSPRLTDIQAALGLSQLSRYDEMLARRAAIAKYYLDTLPDKWTARASVVKDRSIFFRFPLKICGDFDCIKDAFIQHGLHVRKGVDSLLHRKSGMGDGGFQETVRLFEETLSIPIYPALSDEAVERVAIAAKEILG